MESKTVIAGDPHGNFHQIVNAIKTHGVKNVIIVGDIEANKSLDELIPRSLGAEVYYIKGNHEQENPQMWENVIHSSYGKNDISGRVIEIDGIKIAGLSGVFEKEIWYPPNEPNYQDMAAWELINRYDPWYEQKKHKHHTGTIFPNDYFNTAELQVDVLICHEAPDCHPYGFLAINELAQFMNAKQVFHGHHHDNLDYSADTDRMGFTAHGVGLAGLKWISGKELTPGLLDLERNQVREKKMRML